MQEFTKLQKEYYDAQNKYYEPYQKAKTPEETAKIKLDPKLDPGPKFMARFIGLAKRAKHDPNGPAIEYLVVQTARSYPKEIQASIDRILAWHIDHPLRGMGFFTLSEGFRTLSKGRSDAKYLATLTTIETKSKLTENRASALFSLGEYTSSSYSNPNKNPIKAAEYYRLVVKKYPGSKSAEEAGNAIFEMENLQIGMVAPDFEMTDQDGKSWKLSDYRGQVVVLDFWGFW